MFWVRLELAWLNLLVRFYHVDACISFIMDTFHHFPKIKTIEMDFHSFSYYLPHYIPKAYFSYGKSNADEESWATRYLSLYLPLVSSFQRNSNFG